MLGPHLPAVVFLKEHWDCHLDWFSHDDLLEDWNFDWNRDRMRNLDDFVNGYGNSYVPGNWHRNVFHDGNRHILVDGHGHVLEHWDRHSDGNMMRYGHWSRDGYHFMDVHDLRDFFDDGNLDGNWHRSWNVDNVRHCHVLRYRHGMGYGHRFRYRNNLVEIFDGVRNLPSFFNCLSMLSMSE